MSIVVSGISKSYNQQKALDAISFSIRQGEIVGFLGPNGAGKSTMMKILTTYSNPSEGTALVHNFDIATNAIEVTFVPEATRISTTTTTIDCPDRWAKVIALRTLLNLQLRLQDGRDPKEELVSEEVILC